MNIRHGELAFIATDNLPKGLKKSTSQVIMQGSHQNDHSLVNGEWYPIAIGENVLGYVVAKKGAYLTHAEHGEVVKGQALKKAPLEAGIYEVRTQVEDTNEGMKVVLD